jgi:hypothetical protein
MSEFPCPKPITVQVRQGGGALEVVAEPRDTAVVEVTPWNDSRGAAEAAERTVVHLRGDRLTVEAPDSGSTGWLLRRSPQVRIAIRLPSDCTLQVKVASADVRCGGRYARLDLATASGDAAVEYVTGAASVNTASGNVLLDRVDGRFTAKSASGDVTVTQVGGEVTTTTASGDVTVDDAAGSVRVNTASGDVHLGRTRHGEVNLKTASGKLSVGVAQGTLVWLDLQTLSGRTECDLAMNEAPPSSQAADLTLQLRSVSGDLKIYRVTNSPATSAAL